MREADDLWVKSGEAIADHGTTDEAVAWSRDMGKYAQHPSLVVRTLLSHHCSKRADREAQVGETVTNQEMAEISERIIAMTIDHCLPKMSP